MDRATLLDAFRGLRVADVSDAMDHVGLFDRGLMDREIRPVFRDTDTLAHRIAGPALTVRAVPTNREVPNMPPEHFEAYIGEWYRQHSPEGFRGAIQPGDVLVFDAAGLDIGFIGSNNTLGWMNQGAAGVVTASTPGGSSTTPSASRSTAVACWCAPVTWWWPTAMA